MQQFIKLFLLVFRFLQKKFYGVLFIWMAKLIRVVFGRVRPVTPGGGMWYVVIGFGQAALGPLLSS